MFDSMLKAFDIVTSPYVDLAGDVKSFPNGHKQLALFMVVAVDRGNVIACKITSQSTVYNSPEFTYTLLQDSHSFLKTTSFVQLTKPHTLFSSSCTKVGEVAAFCRPFISKQLGSLFKTLIAIVNAECPLQSYKSPNHPKHFFGGMNIKK